MKPTNDKCECGGALSFYDGALGYEALVCVRCGAHHTHDGKHSGDTRLFPFFVTWEFSGIRFIAFQQGSGIIVIDEQANNYGAWSTVEGFRKRQKDGIPADWSPLGKVSEIRTVLAR